jgi:hypothetical protein
MSEEDRDHDLISAIAPDVIRVVFRRGLFEKLDDKLCPHRRRRNGGKMRWRSRDREALLRALGSDERELKEIFQVFQSRGGFCDCEILYVSETNRLKATYWRIRAADLKNRIHHNSST